MNNLKIVKEQVQREGKSYLNFYLCWSYNDKEYKVRIRSVFPNDFDKLFAISQSVD